MAGIYHSRYDERLHQFCRCIDGIISSRRGKGEADFVSRTQLFINNGNVGVMKEIYRMRSAVEHLRNAESEAVDVKDIKEQRIRIIERVMQAETIARHCLLQIMLNPSLLRHFRNDEALCKLWGMSENEQKIEWGAPLDYHNQLRNIVDRTYVDKDDLL
jgi:hypothetical protein